jgi:polyisoprenoid-binding protein YceI
MIFGVFKKHGSFTELSGGLHLEKKTARVLARIGSASATMKSDSDAALLKSAPYFDAAHFPEIVFASEPFAHSILSRGGQIRGKLTLRGVTQIQVFDLTPKPCAKIFAKTPWRCAFEVTGRLKRTEFGMKARRGIVSDEVELTLTIVPM